MGLSPKSDEKKVLSNSNRRFTVRWSRKSKKSTFACLYPKMTAESPSTSRNQRRVDWDSIKEVMTILVRVIFFFLFFIWKYFCFFYFWKSTLQRMTCISSWHFRFQNESPTWRGYISKCASKFKKTFSPMLPTNPETSKKNSNAPPPLSGVMLARLWGGE